MEAPEITRPEDRVPVPTKLAYGAGGMVIIFLGHLPKNLATPIFVVALGLSPSLVSVAMLIFRVYEAVANPVTGWISDNTRSRWGRRRPFLFAGATLAGLVLPVMWFVSPGWSPNTQMIWFIGTGLVLYTFTSIFAMPYESLNFELTPDYNERTSVTSYKAFFQKIAIMVVSWAWFITQLPMFTNAVTGKPDAISGARALSVVVGLAVVGVGMLPVFFDRASVSAFADAAVATCVDAPLFSYACARSPRIGRTIASTGAELVLSAAILDWDTTQNLRFGFAVPAVGKELVSVRPVSVYLAYGLSF